MRILGESGTALSEKTYQMSISSEYKKNKIKVIDKFKLTELHRVFFGIQSKGPKPEYSLKSNPGLQSPMSNRSKTGPF